MKLTKQHIGKKVTCPGWKTGTRSIKYLIFLGFAPNGRDLNGIAYHHDGQLKEVFGTYCHGDNDWEWAEKQPKDFNYSQFGGYEQAVRDLIEFLKTKST